MCKTTKKDQVVPLQNSRIKIGLEIVSNDPQLLFQRFVAVRNKYSDCEDLFRYELCSYPAALFETSLLPREAKKPELANALWSRAEVSDEPISQEITPGAMIFQFNSLYLLHHVMIHSNV